MNNAMIAGHLGADPETRFTSNGQKVTTLRLASKARKSGGDDTIWWRVTLWGDQFDKMLAHLKKGSALMVIGEMQKPEIYNDREGRPQISMNITAFSLQFSPFGKTERSEARPQESMAMSGAYQEPQEEKSSSSSFDDEVPF